MYSTCLNRSTIKPVTRACKSCANLTIVQIVWGPTDNTNKKFDDFHLVNA